MLYAGNNRIIHLNITGLTQLEELFVENNYLLANLDISGLTALKKVKLMKNKISKLDVSALKELEELEMDDNNIERAVVRGAVKLKLLKLQNNPIKVTVDIRGLTELEYCNFLGCNLLFINFSGTVKLKKCDW